MIKELEHHSYEGIIWLWEKAALGLGVGVNVYKYLMGRCKDEATLF